VEAVAHPVPDSEINFELWIPTVAAWNGRFQGVGNGGYSGALDYGRMAGALRKGFATAGHDTGHPGDDMRFGQGHPEKVIDYAYRAVHVMTETSKLILRVQTGKFPMRSYFVGCSAGGHQALSEAQRYPEDYDGIIAGAPANNRLRQTFGFLRSWNAMHADGVPIVPVSKLAMITKAATESCDALDGLKDGLIDDPRRCKFDPKVLLCKGADEPGCLTEPQVEAVRKLYDGWKDEKTGKRMFAGYTRGSEDIGGQSWATYHINPPEPPRLSLFRYFLFHDPNWSPRTLDMDRDLAYAEEKLGFMDATETKLTAFEKRGGKLILYTGWADSAVAPEDTIAYYEGVTKAMGGPERTGKFARLFMVPGMGHCLGGPGPNQFYAMGALEPWVETGQAPEKIVASHSSPTNEPGANRTRPLCPYPQVARYKGSGSIDEAQNFVCANPGVAAAKKK
jgi:feruloyl esterase